MNKAQLAHKKYARTSPLLPTTENNVWLFRSLYPHITQADMARIFGSSRQRINKVLHGCPHAYKPFSLSDRQVKNYRTRFSKILNQLKTP